jgi:hypothetical protein
MTDCTVYVLACNLVMYSEMTKTDTRLLLDA